MLFSIDEDTGTRIVGWLMPDNPSHTPVIAVYEGNDKLAEVRARIVRPLLREQGLHDTGLCGFVIDDGAVPNLAGKPLVELYDAETLTLIYRRRNGRQSVQHKLFRLETQMLPDAHVNTILDTHFQMTYRRVEVLPHETINSVIAIPFSNSLYVSGRLYIAEYEPLLRDRAFKTCVCLRDPVEELAEQLLMLEWMARKGEDVLKQLQNARLTALTEAMKGKKLANSDDYGSFLLRAGHEERWILCDPTTRLLTCRSADEQLSAVAVASALDALSNFTAVGTRAETEEFIELLAAQLEWDFSTAQRRPTSPLVTDLAIGLRELPLIRQMLSADLELFDTFTQARDRALKLV